MSLNRYNIVRISAQTIRRLLPEIIFGVVLILTFVCFYWAEDFDARFAKSQTARILAPLDKKIAVAEAAKLSAASGLKEQRARIMQSVLEGAKFSDGYHPLLLSENRIFVHRLKKVNHRTIAGPLNHAVASLNPTTRMLFSREADRWWIYGILCGLFVVFAGIRLARRRFIRSRYG